MIWVDTHLHKAMYCPYMECHHAFRGNLFVDVVLLHIIIEKLLGELTAQESLKKAPNKTTNIMDCDWYVS